MPKNTTFEEGHSNKLKAVEAAFARLQTLAKATGSVNKCSLSKICAETGVSTSYFSGDKPKSNLKISEEYNNFAKRVTKWRDNFQENQAEVKDNSELGKALKTIDERESERDKAHTQNSELLAKNEALRAKVDERNQKVSELHASATDIGLFKSENRKQFKIFSQAKVVSPDHYLYKDGVYQFGNKALRDIAWETARSDLVILLQRPIPMRVYLLCGMTGAGKTTWSEESHYYEDRHSVVIDATNLTVIARANWLNIILREKYKPNVDIRTCAVVFDVPYSTLIARNKKHRRIEEKRYLELYQSQEKIDIPSENFDEVMVVRHG